ncbi:MAG: heparinase II/III family protein [Armatimonadetes bacterium]|nr:heparinase II/III family protein [Armatimonadota bacterium]
MAGAVGRPAEPPPGWTGEQAIARAGIDYPEDTTEWLAWKSGNLAARLNPRTPRDLVLVLSFSGNHAGGREFARFRKVEVEMSDDVPPAPPLQRRWPLKTAQSLWTADELALARQRAKDLPEAQALLKNLIAGCQNWLAVPDADLYWRIPDQSVPRGFDCSTHGCPVHGTKVFEFGTYPWKQDFEHPYQITCPVGGETYPSGDFAAYLKGGKKDAGLIAGPYEDSGWGWVAPDGERYWLTAHACHWYWQKFILPGLHNLSRAYLLTGDKQYAHKAAAMLLRIAQVYPSMDHEFQSRYGSMSPGYSGKIVNHIWETQVIRNLGEAYDNLWDSLDGDAELQQEAGLSGEQIRGLIETNLLEHGLDCILDGHIVGNYGMHQSAFAVLVAVRQTAPRKQLLAEVLDKTGAEGRYEGVRYALYNWIWRDGVPYETSPGYNFIWTDELTALAQLVERAGIDLYADPQFRRLLHWPIDITVNDRFTPAEGDAGDIRHGRSNRDFDVYRAAFEHYGADFAAMFDESGGQTASFRTYESLFRPELREKLKQALAEHPRERLPSRLLDGYGMAILNNPAETLGLQCYYGWRGGHSHRDGLHVDLYAYGLPVTPDTGYPDFMNGFVSGIYSWSKSTICHNTVTVNARQQDGNQGGQVRRFGALPGLQYVDIEAPGNYAAVREYRRALALIATDEQNGWLLDVFRVAGGKQHDYSLHGTVGERKVLAGSFGPVQTQGTLAGETVAVGQLYDDPVLGAPGYKGQFYGYLGSGFQHLVNVQRQTAPGPVVVEVTAAAEPHVKLRLHLLRQPGQEAILAEAQISPLKHLEHLPYLLARRQGDDLTSTFTCVLEPFTGQPLLQRVEAVATAPDAVAVRAVRSDGGAQVVLQARDGSVVRAAGEWFRTDAPLAVVTYDAAGAWQTAALVGGTQLAIGGETRKLPGDATGRITAVDPVANTVGVAWDGAVPGELVGRSVYLGNELRDNVFEITSAAAAAGVTTLGLRAGLRCGRGRVTGVDATARRLTSDTGFQLMATYPGMRVVNAAGQGYQRIRAAGGGGFELEGEGDLAALFGEPGGGRKAEFWVIAVGPGDRVRLESAVTLRR